MVQDGSKKNPPPSCPRSSVDRRRRRGGRGGGGGGGEQPRAVPQRRLQPRVLVRPGRGQLLGEGVDVGRARAVAHGDPPALRGPGQLVERGAAAAAAAAGDDLHRRQRRRLGPARPPQVPQRQLAGGRRRREQRGVRRGPFDVCNIVMGLVLERQQWFSLFLRLAAGAAPKAPQARGPVHARRQQQRAAAPTAHRRPAPRRRRPPGVRAVEVQGRHQPEVRPVLADGPRHGGARAEVQRRLVDGAALAAHRQVSGSCNCALPRLWCAWRVPGAGYCKAANCDGVLLSSTLLCHFRFSLHTSWRVW
mmetsp:Transcript_631/g.1112  ORF Transcript_631/g.1112 Transcript_631/m.1112 type:complete len:305 (-) Transcript_631:194-1108(-)